MHHSTRTTLSALLALAASTTTFATPLSYNSTTTLSSRNDANTFNLHVWNNCHFTKEVALYSVTADFKMLQRSPPTNIAPGHSITIAAPFYDSGMRLSGHAEWGTDGQWRPQALFEFGYSTYAGQEGTAYDLSLMEGSDKDIGMGAYPVPNGHGSGTSQNDVGASAPDTVCYKGRSDFKIVYCP
ncbi:hypothetical protein LTR48_003612 [Friedmanniomyces endolithicus]|uniref:Uncharacterized protein n=1 Tax=Rachicladosporium monterosium TaxID=1507873 RepID=A0ABR0L7L8_9PEZI|nr:hypothetical protein LTR29_001283 [Friedmanniomyces endolithicus]KAK1092800.1 hypothetical protein LTR48_003612 [Friedmanniomyces endolithicus]KAK1813055.1 hypothetical protein LTR12_012577 [Friedmanniomyces endolithicus]KAK5144746.1 hypothetical protein LTR32_003387 [Rachicladosporium monterosium]